ncbi:PREDICTED: spindle and centriole-associated protein 1-like, partial [Priapulus caudatus]|uniref:Spindle and centriole-associated protein 1 n=1 Tax=Priapulus caudatus TaxID=37621 RepID=A0ABM1E8Y9_PRICU
MFLCLIRNGAPVKKLCNNRLIYITIFGHLLSETIKFVIRKMSHIKSLAVSKPGRRQIHPSQPPKTTRHAHRPRQTKKKALPVPPWDNTVNDLEVHKASPEEINRRQELRKSKNVDLVKWEEQEKAIQRACKNKVPTSVEKRKAHLLREILYDDSQLQDVLDKSDKMLTVVRDLYGDELRHKYKARPKITPAPSLEKSSAKVLNEWPPDEEVSDDATPINAEVTDSSFSTEEKENVDVEFTNTRFQGARRKVKDEGPYAMNDTA